MNKTLLISTLTMATALGTGLLAPAGVYAQAATAAMAPTVTPIAMPSDTNPMMPGWSVKKSMLGRSVYNDAGVKIGKIEDLIISADRNLTYAIVGAGGFVGIGVHDVAIPIKQLEPHDGKIGMAGATKESIKALPEFVYARDSGAGIRERDRLVARADRDIAKAKAKVSALQSQSAAASVDAKVKIDQQVAALQNELTVAQGKLDQMKQASVGEWKQFESAVSAETARLRALL
jgi:hypothetical protein